MRVIASRAPETIQALMVRMACLDAPEFAELHDLLTRGGVQGERAARVAALIGEGIEVSRARTAFGLLTEGRVTR